MIRRAHLGFSLHPLARAVALATAPFATLASAQEEQSVRLEEVLVTATKREVNMQDVAQSIQAFNNKLVNFPGQIIM